MWCDVSVCMHAFITQEQKRLRYALEQEFGFLEKPKNLD